MLDLISIILIFILDSLPQTSSKGFLIMPYLTYLSYRRDKKNLFLLPLMGIILSLHSSEPIYSFIFIAINITVYYLYFSNFDYNLGNIFILSIAQIIMWKIFVGDPLIIVKIIVTSLIYFIINLFYMRRATKWREI